MLSLEHRSLSFGYADYLGIKPGDMLSDLHSKFTCDSPPVNLLATNSRNGAKINIADSRKLFAITRCERSRVCPGTVYSHCTLSSRHFLRIG